MKIRELYRIEHDCDKAGMDFEERRRECRLKSGPVMAQMRKWLETEGIKYSESSLIGKAVTHAYTRWDNMERILEDGRLLLDNNLAYPKVLIMPPRMRSGR